jgi:pyruvate,water dikinase
VSQDRIISLDTCRHIDKTAIGSKALSLIRLSRIGLQVPAGFCITAAAFREHLEQNNLIENADDIFFLRQEEIAPVVKGRADFEIRQVVAARRAEYDKNNSVVPPDVVFGKFDPDNYVPDTQYEHAEVLKGIGVSPGRATGKARAILRADGDQQLLAGEILVAPFTDPGWTPYFVPAAAIVMDEGGVISHGSIVAREYGIPAVVNVGNATKVIKTGQKIQVDGDLGVVRILQ